MDDVYVAFCKLQKHPGVNTYHLGHPDVQTFSTDGHRHRWSSPARSRQSQNLATSFADLQTLSLLFLAVAPDAQKAMPKSD